MTPLHTTSLYLCLYTSSHKCLLVAILLRQKILTSVTSTVGSASLIFGRLTLFPLIESSDATKSCPSTDGEARREVSGRRREDEVLKLSAKQTFVLTEVSKAACNHVQCHSIPVNSETCRKIKCYRNRCNGSAFDSLDQCVPTPLHELRICAILRPRFQNSPRRAGKNRQPSTALACALNHRLARTQDESQSRRLTLSDVRKYSMSSLPLRCPA